MLRKRMILVNADKLYFVKYIYIIKKYQKIEPVFLYILVLDD